MELGKYLKKCRELANRTQPDVAAEIEIEQSYLSKLESGKSTPSAEIFDKLCQVYDIDIEDMISQLSPTERKRLSELEAIKRIVAKQNKVSVDTTRKWLITGLIMLMLGAGFLALSIVPDRSGEKYHYRSQGVLQLGEDLSAYDLIYKDLSLIENDPSKMAKRAELMQRLDQKDVVSDTFKGDGYAENSKEGRRFFELVSKQKPSRNYWNVWFLAPSFMFLIGGFACFFIAKRWRVNTTD